MDGNARLLSPTVKQLPVDILILIITEYCKRSSSPQHRRCRERMQHRRRRRSLNQLLFLYYYYIAPCVAASALFDLPLGAAEKISHRVCASESASLAKFQSSSALCFGLRADMHKRVAPSI
jgi:hypothetical protein